MPEWMVEVWAGDGKLLVIGAVIVLAMLALFFWVERRL